MITNPRARSIVWLPVLLAAATAHATPVTVNNSSFETPAVATWSPAGSFEGWTQIGGSVGVQRYSAMLPFTNQTGPQVGWASSVGSMQSAAPLATIAAGETYTLKVDAGSRSNYASGGCTIALVDTANTVLASTSLNLPDNDTMLEQTVVFTAASGHVSIGNGLKIRLANNSGLQAQFDNVRLDVSNTADMPRWMGNQGQEWTTGGNWVLHSNGTTPTSYTEGDAVLFDNSAATRTVAINGANVSPSAVTFSNDTQHPYTLQGTHGIAAGSITKNDDGTVTISNANNTSGGIQLNGGTVAIAHSAGLGTGALGFANGTTLRYDASNATWTRAMTLDTGGGTLDIASNGTTLTLAGTIGGAGGLVKSGGGTLALSASNNYGGPTVIGGGTLAIGSATIIPAGSALILANGGTLQVSNNNTSVNNNLTVANGDFGVIKVGTGINQQVNGSLAGVAGNLILDVSNANDGGINLTGSAMGTTAPGSVVTLLNAGGNKTWLFFSSASARAALGNSRIVMNQTGAGSALINLGFGGETVQLGALDGGNSSCAVGFHFGGSGTLQLDGTASGNFAGKIEPGVALIKTGSATQAFSASGFASGAISITGGTLEIAGPNAHASSISIASAGTLVVDPSGSLKFTPTTNGTVNGISGTGAVQVNGSIVIDLTGANTTAGNTWKLLDAATVTESYGSGFSVEGFSETTRGSGVWSSFDGVRTWTFAETTGMLTLSGGALHHRYDGNFTDSSGSANHGTPHGAAAIGSTIASGSGSLVLDGADDCHVSLASPISRTAAQPWTITWWARRDRTSPDMGMVMGTAEGVSDFIWLNDSLTGLRFCSSANATLDFTVPKDAAPHHYALVADGAGSLRLYLDGLPAATLAGDTSFTVDAIGKACPTTSSQQNFKGSLDEVHLLESALGDAQIAQIHRSESLVTRLRIVLIGGQSNTDGQGVNAELPSNLQDPLNDVPMVYKAPDGAGGPGDPDPFPGVVTPITLTPLRPGLSGNPSCFGPEIRLGHMLADLYHDEPGTRVAIIKYARGATNLAVNWKAGGTATTAGDGAQYLLFQETVNQGMALLAAAYPMATLDLQSMVWMQGESDAMDNSWAAAYQTNLTGFIADVRATYGAGLPFVIGRLSTTQTYFDATRLNQVRAAQDAVAAADPRTAIIYTETFGLRSDNIHFNTNGQLAMGDAFANETAYDSWMTESFSAAEIDAGLAEPDVDADGDGRNNREEFLGVSDPMSATSQFRAIIIVTGDNSVAISYPTSSARTYQVERFNEADGTWPVLLPALRGTGGTVTRPLGALGSRGIFRVRTALS